MKRKNIFTSDADAVFGDDHGHSTKKRKNIFTSDADAVFGDDHGHSTKKRKNISTSDSDDGSGDHRFFTKSRRTSNFTTRQEPVLSPSHPASPTPQKKPEDIAGSSPIIITPPCKPPHLPSSSPSPASVLSVQTSVYSCSSASVSSSASETILHLSVSESSTLLLSQTANQTSRFHISNPAATGITLALKPLSNNENSNGWKEDESHDETLDLIVARKLFDSPTRDIFYGHKSDHQSKLLNRLKEQSTKEPAFEVVGKKASEGAMLLQEASREVNE